MSGNNPQIRQFVAAPGGGGDGESKEDKPVKKRTPERAFSSGDWVCFNGGVETHDGKKIKVHAYHLTPEGEWKYDLQIYKGGRWVKESGELCLDKNGVLYRKPDYWVLENGRLDKPNEIRYDISEENISKIAPEWEPPPPKKRRRKKKP